MRSQRWAESRNRVLENHDKSIGFYIKWNKKSLVVLIWAVT